MGPGTRRSVHGARVHLGHGPGVVDVAAEHHERPAPATVRVQRHLRRVPQVAGTVAGQFRAVPHAARQHDREGAIQRQVQEERRFLQRVGAVRDDHAVHVLQRPDQLPERQHVRGRDVRTGQRERLVRADVDALQARHLFSQGRRDLRRHARPAGIGSARDGASGVNEGQLRGGGERHGPECSVHPRPPRPNVHATRTRCRPKWR